MSASSYRQVDISALRSVLSYDAETGHLTWLKDVARNVKAGTRAGHLAPNGYRYIGLFKTVFKEARVCFALATGKWPSGHVDHINGIVTDNRICNLRDVSPRENSMNRKILSRNTSGLKGVYRAGSKWAAKIHFCGQRIYLGSFETKELAHSAYVEAAKKYHGEFANDGVRSLSSEIKNAV